MKNTPDDHFDLDKFYSSESIDEWKQIIGEELHYHFGHFHGAEDLETGLKQAVRNYYPHIAHGSHVLDVGCGWGGPANMLIKELNCSVTGITLSTTQAEYCQQLGLNVWQQDLEYTHNELPNDYDVVFSLEMISHIRDKAQLLHRLRSCAPRLILSENCVADDFPGERIGFGDSMLMCTVSELIHFVEAAGWKIQSVQNRRFQSLRTFVLWKQNLDRVYGERQPPGQFDILRRHVDAALSSPMNWGHSFPLIDIIAN